MEEEIYQEIQRLIVYMIPEKWKNIKLYASVNLQNKNIEEAQDRELFFYYLPNKLFKKEYINCYEIPSLFNIEQEEYFDLITKLYNKILILQTLEEKPFTNITIIIEENNFKIEKYYNDIQKSLFSSYERHIIWRYVYLNIKPISKKEIMVIEKYLDSEEQEEIPKIYEIKMETENSKNIMDYERVLTVEEAIERSLIAEKQKIDLKKEEEKNRIQEQLKEGLKNTVKQVEKIAKEKPKKEKINYLDYIEENENENENKNKNNNDDEYDNDNDDEIEEEEDIVEILKKLKDKK